MRDLIMYGWMHGWGSPAGDVFGSIMMLLFWILPIIALLFFFQYMKRQDGRTGGKGETSLDILKRRYAKGEIDKKEFEEKKKDLGDIKQ